MDSPLTSTHKGQMNKALASLSDAVRHCDTADAAGLDVSEQRQRIEWCRQRLEQMRNVYFQAAGVG